MRGPDTATLDRLAAAEKWLRRCNGMPRAGILESREGLAVVLRASVDVHLDEEGHIAWRGAGPMSVLKNRFTAEPYVPPPPDP